MGIFQDQSFFGSSLVAYWLGFWTFTTMAWVQSLVVQLRSCKLSSVVK